MNQEKPLSSIERGFDPCAFCVFSSDDVYEKVDAIDPDDMAGLRAIMEARREKCINEILEIQRIVKLIDRRKIAIPDI